MATGQILNVGEEVFRYHAGQVLDHASDARAAVVLAIDYGTGRMYIEPFTPGVPSLWRRIRMRVRYGYRYPRPRL